MFAWLCKHRWASAKTIMTSVFCFNWIRGIHLEDDSCLLNLSTKCVLSVQCIMSPLLLKAVLPQSWGINTANRYSPQLKRMIAADYLCTSNVNPNTRGTQEMRRLANLSNYPSRFWWVFPLLGSHFLPKGLTEKKNWNKIKALKLLCAFLFSTSVICYFGGCIEIKVLMGKSVGLCWLIFLKHEELVKLSTVLSKQISL